MGPLVASVGGVGLAVGLATQSVAQNVVAAISLYSGGPFLAGDTVELWNGGGVLVAAGVVRRLLSLPLRLLLMCLSPCAPCVALALRPCWQRTHSLLCCRERGTSSCALQMPGAAVRGSGLSY